MSDPNDKMADSGPVTGLQSIREVMAALRAAQEAELREEVLAERRQRRQAQEKRIKERRERQMQEIRARHTRRENALKAAHDKVGTHITAATRELQAALRDATSVPLPRHSPQGREQLRVRRSIESALAALRSIGRGTFHETDVDLDLETDG